MGGSERSLPPFSERDQLGFWRGRIETVIREINIFLVSGCTLESWARATTAVPLILQGILNKYGKDYTSDYDDPNFVPYQELIFRTSVGDRIKIFSILEDDLKEIEGFSWYLTDNRNPRNPTDSTLCFPNYRAWQDLEPRLGELSLTLFKNGSPRHYSFVTDEERLRFVPTFLEVYLEMLRALYDFLRDKEDALS